VSSISFVGNSTTANFIEQTVGSIEESSSVFDWIIIIIAVDCIAITASSKGLTIRIPKVDISCLSNSQ
jgi:hypothetical protein